MVDLIVADRQGVEVDYCPTCRGVWLDRGELDKLIDRAATVAVPPTARNRYDENSDDYPAQYGSRGGGSYDNQPRKKLGSFLSELFDFG